MEAELFLETDDAVLGGEGVHAGAAYGEEQHNRQEDVPDQQNPVLGPVVDGQEDGKEDIQEQEWRDEEVPGRIEAGVVFVILGCGHGAVPSVVRQKKRITENTEEKANHREHGEKRENTEKKRITENTEEKREHREKANHREHGGKRENTEKKRITENTEKKERTRRKKRITENTEEKREHRGWMS